MLARLSIRNMKRSLRDYSIYILTLTIAFSLMYAFNLICDSPDLMKLTKSMEDFREVNGLLSIVIIVVIGWLINYIVRYMINQRGREFSIYMLLGIKNNSIYRMFFVENLLLCMACLLLGILFGSLLFQFLAIIIMKVFQVEYQMRFPFSFEALGLTIIYAAGMMLLSLVMNSRKLRKLSIYDLMCSEKKGELEEVAKKSGGNIFLFIAFCGIGIFGLTFLHYITIVDDELLGFKNMFISILSIIICIYGSYISLSPAIVRMFLKNNRKYKGNRMIVFRELAAKMNTMRLTLGNMAILLTVTFLAVQTGMLMKGFLDELFISRAPFDVMCTSVDEKEDFGRVLDYLQKHEGIREKYQYNIYEPNFTDVGGFFVREITESDWGTVMKQSDYVKLRKMLGYTEAVDCQDGYLLHCVENVKNTISKQDNTDINFRDKTYQLRAMYMEGFGLEGMNGVYFVLVVPDEVTSGMKINHTTLAISTVSDTTEATNTDLEQLLQVMKEENAHERLSVKGALWVKNCTSVIIVSFVMFYIGLIFACVVAAIMAIRQLGDLMKHRYHYHRLSQLGMTEKQIDNMFLQQMLIYFAVPFILPLPISISMINSIGHIFEAYVNKRMLLGYMLGAIISFGFIYALYFALTYFSYVKGIRGGNTTDMI